MVCLRGTDTALALTGEAEFLMASLTALGVPDDEAEARRVRGPSAPGRTTSTTSSPCSDSGADDESAPPLMREMSVAEQRCRAVLAVISDARTITKVAA